MIIAGNCLYYDENDTDNVISTAWECQHNGFDYFRCKIYGGGPNVQKYAPGIGDGGIGVLADIDKNILPTLTEIRTIEQFNKLIPYTHISGVWIGARSAQNYDLVKYCCENIGDKVLMIKRHFGMTIDETIGLYDLCVGWGKEIYIIERGIVTFDRKDVSRWSPDLKGCLFLKYDRQDIFKRLVVDCSHSVFDSRMVGDVHDAFKAIGVQNFMFECTHDGESMTDKAHMITVEKVKEIVCEKL